MKKLIPILLMLLFLTSGCLIKDTFDGIDIYTTVYPVEYITSKLYGEHSNIHSIYPDEIDISTYKLNKKQIKDYSECTMYIFDGLSNEKNYVTPMFKNNKNLLIIDSTTAMEYSYYNEELWLDPSNFLMMTLNVKNGLDEYIENHYLKNEIEENYKNLKLEISNLDARLKLLSESANDATILVDKSSFKFLEKYGFTVISLEEDSNLTEKIVSDARNAIEDSNLHYIFTTNKNKLNETVQNLVSEFELEVLELNTISNLTDEQRNNNEDYITIFNENIEQLKNELY